MPEPIQDYAALAPGQQVKLLKWAGRLTPGTVGTVIELMQDVPWGGRKVPGVAVDFPGFGRQEFVDECGKKYLTLADPVTA